MYKRWQLVSRKQLAGGLLEVVAWEGDRMLRVWLPPGEQQQQQGLLGSEGKVAGLL